MMGSSSTMMILIGSMDDKIQFEVLFFLQGSGVQFSLSAPAMRQWKVLPSPSLLSAQMRQPRRVLSSWRLIIYLQRMRPKPVPLGALGSAWLLTFFVGAEKVLKCFAVHARASVVDFDMDEAVVFVVEFGVDGDFSFGSVLQGIVYKVA